MSIHMQREMQRLKKDVLSLCAIVEEQVERAVQALMQRDESLAIAVERRDAEIDYREVEIEEECLKVLALYQPVAVDLRLLVAILKVNSNLERIGDLAVNIAHKALALAALPPAAIPFDLSAMGQKTQSMLKSSIDALVNMDAEVAEDVCRRDDEVDCLKHDIRHKSEELIQQEPHRTKLLLILMAVSRNLERIADHATNIAQDVVYIVQGRVVRHSEVA